MFKEVPASKISIAQRKPVQGVGTNDASYQVTYKDESGKSVRCPFYSRWVGMLQRCYSHSHQTARPTYVGCSVARVWLTFSNFKLWMADQDWEGKHLDKDLHVSGNKVYSPENCQFVTQAINCLLTDSAAARGEWPQGVDWNKQRGKFKARIKIDGKSKQLGWFDDSAAASRVYRTAKREDIIRHANLNKDDPQLFADLIRSSKSYLTCINKPDNL